MNQIAPVTSGRDDDAKIKIMTENEDDIDSSINKDEARFVVSSTRDRFEGVENEYENKNVTPKNDNDNDNVSPKENYDLPSFSVGDHVWRPTGFLGLEQLHAIVVCVDHESIVVTDFGSREQRLSSRGRYSRRPTHCAIPSNERRRWSRVAYCADAKALLLPFRRGLRVSATDDDPRLVLARARHLIARPPDALLAPRDVNVDEFASVWCKTGRWTDRQTATRVDAAREFVPGTLDVLIGCATSTTSAAATTTTSTATMTASVSGMFPALTLAFHPVAFTVGVLGGSLLTGAIPLLSLNVNRDERRRTERELNEEFWRLFWSGVTREVFDHVCSFLF